LVNSGVNFNFSILIDLFALLLLLLPPDILLVIGKSNIEVEGLVPLGKSEANEGMFSPAIFNLQYKVAGGINNTLNRALPVA